MPPQLVVVTSMSQKTNQTKANKKYLEYSEMSKEDLVEMLKRVHARIKRLSTSIKELEGEIESLRQLLLYGSGGTSTSGASGGYKGRTGGGYKGRGYSGYKYGGKYRRKAPQPAQPEEGGEEPVEEEEEEPVEEGPKPAEKKPGEAKVETKPERGGS
jgi:hypothetical protein